MNITVDKDDVYATITSFGTSPVWTFKTISNFRVKFEFEKIRVYDGSNSYSALEIGDGISPGSSTRLAHFRGLALRRDVSSIPSSAWLKVIAPFTLPPPKPGILPIYIIIFFFRVHLIYN